MPYVFELRKTLLQYSIALSDANRSGWSSANNIFLTAMPCFNSPIDCPTFPSTCRVPARMPFQSGYYPHFSGVGAYAVDTATKPYDSSDHRLKMPR